MSKVRITEHFHAFGPEFNNIKPGQIHEVVQEGSKALPGVWIMGVTEPVRLLKGEYTYV